MGPGDTAQSLWVRWHGFRGAFLAGPESFFELMRTYTLREAWCADQAAYERGEDDARAWYKDPAGVWHWSNHVRFGGTVRDAAELAIASRPEGPSWFWWNETPAPLADDDSASSLTSRWSEWRSAFHTGKAEFIAKLFEWSVDAVRHPDGIVDDSSPRPKTPTPRWPTGKASKSNFEDRAKKVNGKANMTSKKYSISQQIQQTGATDRYRWSVEIRIDENGEDSEPVVKAEGVVRGRSRAKEVAERFTSWSLKMFDVFGRSYLDDDDDDE